MKTTLCLMVALGTAFPLRAAVLSYSYDSAGRLTAVSYGGTSNSAYRYDRNGNLLAREHAVDPLAPLAANYTGLITNVTPDEGNAGFVTLKLTPTGAFAGKFTFGGKSFARTGAFAVDGSAPPINVGVFTLALALDVAGGTKRITGTITDGTFTSAVALDQASFDKKKNPVPAGLVGKYTALFLPTAATAGIPQGDGFATLTIDGGGKLRVAGKLADGSKISQGTVLTGEAAWPLFFSLYKQAGFAAGRVVFANNPGTSDFAGTIDWLKPPTPGPVHPGGFTIDLALIGSRYEPPARGQTALDLTTGIPNTTFTASTPAPVAVDVTLDARNKFIIPPGPSKLKLTLAPATGLLSGSFLEGTTTRKFSGLLFQEQNLGSGFFLNSSESRLIQLHSNP